VKIYITSIHVDDQAAALRFYTEVLGFAKKDEIPLGEYSWITVVGPGDPDGPQLSLEPSDHPAVNPYRSALMADGIPITSFAVDDVRAEYERLKGLGVTFTQEPVDVGPVITAVLDDTCGNLIQLAQLKEPGV
jgi:catechol 2,3-dioxygenase-like lactoylglutathione lyase family enzyme